VTPITAISAETVLLYVLMLCRIGGCLMLMPGFSSARVPTQIRAFIAIAATLALAPVLLPTVAAAVAKAGPAAPVRLIATEATVGALIGLMGRVFYQALEFMSTAIASAMGFSNLPGTPIEHTDPIPAISSIITLTATVLFFITDQHWEVIRGLVASYTAMPIDRAFAADFSLAQLGDAMGDAFTLTLQISSPFMLYAVAINFLFGLANKLTPQIAVYFVSVPFIMAGGLLILYFLISDFMKLFMAGFMKWLANG
jgi:flagellar biosynthetic protein FliR